MMYDREAAVRYADTWWDSRNPAFPSFDVDCTNFISQCLLAGGAPMHGYPNRTSGWWLQGGTWSFSWSVAHSLRWYLATSKKGLTATQVSSAEQLGLGDVIAYDFEGDGRLIIQQLSLRKMAQSRLLTHIRSTQDIVTGLIRIRICSHQMQSTSFLKSTISFRDDYSKSYKNRIKKQSVTIDGLLFYCLDSNAFINFSQTIKLRAYLLQREPRELN